MAPLGIPQQHRKAFSMAPLVAIAAIALFLPLAAARPSYLPPPAVETTIEETYTPTVVGHTVHHLPTAVSHQSQTIVHEKRPYLRPIVTSLLPVPVVRASVTPILKSSAYDHHHLHHHSTPLVQTYATPILKSTYAPLSGGWTSIGGATLGGLYEPYGWSGGYGTTLVDGGWTGAGWDGGWGGGAWGSAPGAAWLK